MGFFSKLFGRPKSPMLQETDGEGIRSETEAREQHYMFAHRVLPSIARHSPDELLEDLSDPETADGMLQIYWDISGKELTGRDLVPPDGLNAFVRRFEEYRIAIVTLPLPVGMTEAYFVALVFSSEATPDGEI